MVGEVLSSSNCQTMYAPFPLHKGEIEGVG